MARNQINDTSLSTIDGYNMAISGTTGIKTTGGSQRAGNGTTAVNMNIVGYDTPATLFGRSWEVTAASLISTTGYCAGALKKTMSGSGIGTYTNLFRKGSEVSQGYGITPYGEVHAVSGSSEIATSGLIKLRGLGWYTDGTGAAAFGYDTVGIIQQAGLGVFSGGNQVLVAGSGDQSILNGRTNGQSYIYRVATSYIKKTLPTRNL